MAPLWKFSPLMVVEAMLSLPPLSGEIPVTMGTIGVGVKVGVSVGVGV